MYLREAVKNKTRNMEDKWNAKTLRLIGRRLEFQFNTVFDIGVAKGTPELYKAYSDKKIILVEPLPIYEEFMQKTLKTYNAQWVKSAAGSEDSEIEIHYDEALPAMSSIHTKTPITSGSNKVKTQRVPIKKIDTIVEELQLEGPFMLKIDTEGHELNVIKGATETLKNTDLVVAEVSVAKRFNNSYKFSDFIKEMEIHGFELLDILTYSKTPPKFLDAVFTKVPWRKVAP